MDLRSPVVIDSGSGFIKAGWAGEDKPKVVLPTVVGRPKHHRVMSGGALEGKELFVGKKVEEHRGALLLSHPLQHGRVGGSSGGASSTAVTAHTTAWAEMEALWSHVFDPENLKTASTEQAVLLTETALTSRAQREKTAEVFFESLHVPALYLCPTAPLSLYASGRTTGCVVEVGEGSTVVTPLYEGFAVTHAIQRHDLGGKEVTEQLITLLRKNGVSLSSTAEREIARSMKESSCYTAANPAAEEAAVRDRSYEHVEYKLPDGQKLLLGAERFRACEVLFQPSLLGLEAGGGVASSVVTALSLCDLALRPALAASITLAGGQTAGRGFGQRLLSEVRRGLPADAKVKVWAPAERKLLAWVGGSILGSLSTFKGMWTSKAQWEEEGPNSVHRAAL